MTLKEIKRRVKAGQHYAVTNHQVPDLGTVTVVVKRTANYAFVVEHPLGESNIRWPLAANVEREEDGTLHLLGSGARAGQPYLTLVLLNTAPRDGSQ